ncbi:MAG TPA: bifunctional riboflavin kinase/FAD synthetase [Rhodospirillales bacterium]|nr:bifunctional riboflavin kinase/FAD synthetase [Rhodospirillales bacterium]
MRLFRTHQNLPADVRGSAVAVGNFDGVHVGHQAVIGEAGRIARASNIPWAVMTFEPHPRTVFAPEVGAFRLTPFPVKARLIEALGPEVLFVIPFDAELARVTARAFVEEVLVRGLGASHVICGHDFAFGQGRKGTPELLLWLGDEFGFGFTCVQEVRDTGGEGYSSTRIREYLRRGEPGSAARLLGRPFEIEGEVVAGDQRGRTIGFPTANVRLEGYVTPAHGVYAVRIGLGQAGSTRWYDGVANLGLRPTFAGSEVLLEAHVFDFEGDLYGSVVRVAFAEFIRPEKKFDGIEALRAQIAEDAARARLALSEGSRRLPMARTSRTGSGF